VADIAGVGDACDRDVFAVHFALLLYELLDSVGSLSFSSGASADRIAELQDGAQTWLPERSGHESGIRRKIRVVRYTE
jgi:hypothetical protein